jgi:hypothetical protein
LFFCSTSIIIMHLTGANASLFPVLRIAMPMPSLRMSSPMKRAGQEA